MKSRVQQKRKFTRAEETMRAVKGIFFFRFFFNFVKQARISFHVKQCVQPVTNCLAVYQPKLNHATFHYPYHVLMSYILGNPSLFLQTDVGERRPARELCKVFSCSHQEATCFSQYTFLLPFFSQQSFRKLEKKCSWENIFHCDSSLKARS